MSSYFVLIFAEKRTWGIPCWHKSLTSLHVPDVSVLSLVSRGRLLIYNVFIQHNYHSLKLFSDTKMQDISSDELVNKGLIFNMKQ